MIALEEYLKAVEVVSEYHQQLQSLIDIHSQKNVKQIKKVKCLCNHAGGHVLHFLTVGKDYDVLHDSYKTNHVSKDYNNKTYFCIIDDNGKKRSYRYTNPSGVWEFIW
jgi:hypothetical protein